MMNAILDYGTDHSAIFAAGLTFSVVAVATVVMWAYGRFHQRATRRRDPDLIG